MRLTLSSHYLRAVGAHEGVLSSRYLRGGRTKGYYLRIIFVGAERRGIIFALSSVSHVHLEHLVLERACPRPKQMPVLISAEGRLYRIGNEQALDES